MINLYFWISFLLHVLKDMGLRSYWLTLWVKTRQRKDPLDTLPSRLWETWSTSKSYGSGMLECACTRENVAAVQELTLNHIQTRDVIKTRESETKTRPRPDRPRPRPRPRPGRPRPRPAGSRPRPRPQKSGLDRSRDQDQVWRPTSLLCRQVN